MLLFTFVKLLYFYEEIIYTYVVGKFEHLWGGACFYIFRNLYIYGRLVFTFVTVFTFVDATTPEITLSFSA